MVKNNEKYLKDKKIGLFASFADSNGSAVLVKSIQDQRVIDVSENVNKIFGYPVTQQDFMTCLSHEMRSPLTSIIGFGDIIADRAEFFSTEEIKDIGNNIAKAGQTMHSLTEKCLLYMQMCLTKIDQDKFINKRILESLIYEESVNVGLKFNQAERLRHSVQPASLQVPEKHIRLLVKELVENCFHFSDENSEIIIDGEPRDNCFLLSFNTRYNCVSSLQTTRTEMNGHSDRNFRIRQESGLGLAFVKCICENSGGKLRISRRPDEILSLQCYLPVRMP